LIDYEVEKAMKLKRHVFKNGDKPKEKQLELEI